MSPGPRSEAKSVAADVASSAVATRSQRAPEPTVVSAAAKAVAQAGRASARAWAFIRGPGWAATWKAMQRSEAFLAKVETWLIETLRRKPEPEPEPPPRDLHPRLRFSDLDIDDPEDALHALRRAARVPPHQRRMDERD